MLNMIKGWIGQENTQLSGVIKGKLPLASIRELEIFVRRFNIVGTVRVVRENYAEFIFEGPRHRLSRFLKYLPHCGPMQGKTADIRWGEYTARYRQLRVTWE